MIYVAFLINCAAAGISLGGFFATGNLLCLGLALLNAGFAIGNHNRIANGQ